MIESNLYKILNTRKQLIQYIKSFKVPRIVISETRDVVKMDYRPNDRDGPWVYSWNMEWMGKSTVEGLIALIDLLEDTYGIK
jgi:hypothetical protein